MTFEPDTAPFLQSPALPPHDYVSPGLEIICPDAAFPNMVIGDTSVPKWLWLRRWVEHNWYTDRRNPDVGFANRDEASILYNTALLFRDKPCLEIGCWRGWSAVHLALGAGNLDIIDPVLADPAFLKDVQSSLDHAGVLNKVSLHAGFSPAAVEDLSKSTCKTWSLIFVDADHEGDGPRKDAAIAMRYAASDAIVLFHDLASPYVTAALDDMQAAGWNTMIYQTMQIMGVAWRGNIEPVHHIPDPKIFWTLPKHLSRHAVSGWQEKPRTLRGAWWPDMSVEERWEAAMMRAQTIEDDLVSSDIECRAVTEHERAARLARDAALVERDAALAAERAANAERDAATAERDAANAERDAALAEAQTVGRRTRDDERRLNAAVLAFSSWLVRKRVLLGLLRRVPAARTAAVRQAAVIYGVEMLVTADMAADVSRTRLVLGLLRRSKEFGRALISQRLWDVACVRQEYPASSAPLQVGAPRDFHRNAARFDPSRENIIITVHETSRTGAPILGWNIARILAARYNVFTVRLNNGALTCEFEALSAETHGPFVGPDHTFLSVQQALQPLFKKYKFRYAIVNSTESRIALRAFLLEKIPTLFLVHEFGSYVYPAADLHRAFDDATEIVFPAHIVAASSEQIYDKLRSRRINILPQGMSVIPPGVETPRPGADERLRFLADKRTAGAFLVIGAGTVSFRKGVDLFVAAAAAIRRSKPQRKVHFVWVGHGYAPLRDMGYSIYLKEQVERAGLQDDVTFFGEVSDMDPVYALADAFFLSSRLDPLPNVSIDAAMRGIPIVCFADASGIAELLVQEPQTAISVVGHLDTEEAAQLICRLASDATATAALGAATAQFAVRTFDMEAYAARLDALGREHAPAGL